MSNYPDDFPHHLLDDDEDGNKLSCGCYEEQCECPKCETCGEIIDDDKFLCSSCLEACEHDNFKITYEEVFVDFYLLSNNLPVIVIVAYRCINCGSTGLLKNTVNDIVWGEEE